MGWSTHHPTGLIYCALQHCYRGYTLITNSRGQSASLVDLQGRICHRWHCPEGISYAYLLPHGHLLLRTNSGPPVEVSFLGGCPRNDLAGLSGHSCRRGDRRR